MAKIPPESVPNLNETHLIVARQDIDQVTSVARLALAVGMTDRPSIAQVIRLAMAVKNLTAADTSNQAKINRKQLGEILKNDNAIPNTRTLSRLASVFGDDFLNITLILREEKLRSKGGE